MYSIGRPGRRAGGVTREATRAGRVVICAPAHCVARPQCPSARQHQLRPDHPVFPAITRAPFNCPYVFRARAADYSHQTAHHNFRNPMFIASSL